MKPLVRARVHFFSLAVFAIAMLVTGYGATLAPDTAEAGPLCRAGRFLGRVVHNRQPVRTFFRNRQPVRRLLPRNWGLRAYGAGDTAACSGESCQVDAEAAGEPMIGDDPREPVAP